MVGSQLVDTIDHIKCRYKREEHLQLTVGHHLKISSYKIPAC